MHTLRTRVIRFWKLAHKKGPRDPVIVCHRLLTERLFIISTPSAISLIHHQFHRHRRYQPAVYFSQRDDLSPFNSNYTICWGTSPSTGGRGWDYRLLNYLKTTPWTIVTREIITGVTTRMFTGRSRERDGGAYETWSKVNDGGKSFSDAFTAFPLLAFQPVFRRNLEFTLSRAFGTRGCRDYPLYRVRGGVSPTYESGDKVTLRNCFPQADEGELSPTRTASLALTALSSLPSTKSNSPSPSYLLLRDFFLLHSSNAPLSRALFHPVLLRETSITAKKSRGFTRSRCGKEFYTIVTLSREK